MESSYRILNIHPKYFLIGLKSSANKFLNQARAWFLKTDPVRIVCVSAPEAINN